MPGRDRDSGSYGRGLPDDGPGDWFGHAPGDLTEGLKLGYSPHLLEWIGKDTPAENYCMEALDRLVCWQPWGTGYQPRSSCRWCEGSSCPNILLGVVESNRNSKAEALIGRSLTHLSDSSSAVKL